MTIREGEGITGAAVLSRRTIAVSDAWVHPQHDRRIDKRIDFRTVAMISTPIIYGAPYGAVNILNHRTGGPFPAQWEERMSAVGILYASTLAASGRLVPYKLPWEAGRWNLSAAARQLGIPRKTFSYRLKKWGSSNDFLYREILDLP